MRTNIDKEIEAIDLDQLFDQTVETGLFQQYSDATTAPSSSDDLSYLFEEPSSNGSNPCDTTALPSWGTPNEGDAWHKAIHRLGEQNVASPLIDNDSSSVYPHSDGKASLSDPILSSFEELFILDHLDSRPASQPSSPKVQVEKPTRKARSSPDRSIRDRHGVHKTAHKKSASAGNTVRMMRPSTYRAGFQDIWTRKLDTAAEAFNLHMPTNGIHSPPPSTKLIQDEHSTGFFPREPQPYTIAVSPLAGDAGSSPGIHSVNYQLTPQPSPAVDQNGMANAFQFSNDGMAGAYITNAALSALHTPPPSNRIPAGAWSSDKSPNVDFGSFSSSPNFQNTTKTTGWWSGPNTHSIPVTGPSTTSTYQSPQSRSASQNMGFGTSPSSVTGLGISCDSASFGGYAPEMNDSQNGMPHAASSFDMPPYAAVYPPTPGIPIGHGPANPPSRSPSLSPQPRFTRRRHSSHPHNRTASRRKSSGSSQHSAQASSRGISLGGGFVNFTPDDSRKILTGVAPSGSSKTKARREKEAAEKRRKLSQAAVKAVMEAGGDLWRLEKEGLLALEG
ncbi:uncharacterized protein N0V89_001591 [Didymosphaeria variabile]|uniref:Developmental regulatory protein wetA n=1 Tax=Didymosphaeria variabile TaxID=1932322 RepID=A0A9W9CGV7_9PLEO|nr:uncharacterized protein N0V89_001591 [Didymosphaeria variabile]KAJ4361022.1 hypothetical protein N0V89_001591 [Didymosphaeria variabile]